MTCTDCQAATTTQGFWRQYNSPACAFCSARLIQQLGKLRTPTSEQITARRRAVIGGAIAHGHSELEIRELAKLKTMAVQPVGGGKR
jgi:hypothetical protein